MIIWQKPQFRLGQKVVCIQTLGVDVPLKRPWRAFPKMGETYIIRAYRPDRDFLSVMLEEIVNDIGFDGIEAGYFEDRFRAIDTRETDISCFTALLRNVPELVS
jgi:hypothetical protein